MFKQTIIKHFHTHGIDDYLVWRLSWGGKATRFYDPILSFFLRPQLITIYKAMQTDVSIEPRKKILLLSY
uniref:Uncharacterized protein n=1 Tax=Rhizophora mucronata TaxID=61149 RepID=A0A2P2PQE5_RHIMU